MLGTLENAFDISYNPVMGDVGSGQFTIPSDDPKVALLTPGNLIKVKLDAVYIGGMWIKPWPYKKYVKESSERRITIRCDAMERYFDRGIMWNESHLPGGMDPFTTETSPGVYSGKGIWRLTAAGTGNRPGQMIWRVIVGE